MNPAVLWRSPLNRLRRRIAIMRFDYVAEPAEVTEFNFSALRRMVLVKPDGKLGDTQIIISFLKEVTCRCPHLRTAVICPQGMAGLYRRFSGIEDIYLLPPHPKSSEINQVCRDVLRNGSADLLLSTEDACKPRDIMLYGRLHPQLLASLDPTLKCVNLRLYPKNAGRHMSDYLTCLMRLGGLEITSLPYVRLFGPEEEARAHDLLGERPCIGVAPCGAARARKLSQEACSAIAGTITASGHFTVVPLVSKSQELWAGALAAGTDRLLRLPPLDVCTLAAVIARLQAVISVDSAPVHLAGAAKVPVFGIYSGIGSEVMRWYPRPEDNPKSRVFSVSGRTIAALTGSQLTPALRDFLGNLDN